ncbi:hypothetical protein C2845_PM03G18870 [Panicum miliaceum]|uniref:DUF4220 domain-containing protein n=1 Tax=Panicum miliaceum TaxID=4540 RepID=A0A3L6T595_PANMI|nr:hypothetical protein C2845_PM03G18870 [Panicum miliaceum]
MVGGNPALNCSAGAIHECSSRMVCPVNGRTTFDDSMRGEIWRVNALLLTESILAGVIVGIGAYGQRYRHHPITRFIFLGATTLFLPIISSVISSSTVGPSPNIIINSKSSHALVATCHALGHSMVLILWAFLVQIVMISTSTLVAVDDREGQSKGPPFELLVQGVWTLYLGLDEIIDLFIFIPFSLLCSKIVLKYYAFQKARRSFALGCNPGLVFVHMQKLQAHKSNQHVEAPIGEEAHPPPPPLLMREEEKQVEMQPRGYSIKDDSRTTSIDNIGLVTIDKVWQLDSKVPIATPQLKDLCLSFALFKLPRSRFARCNLTNAGSMGTLTFFRSLFLKVGEHDRASTLLTFGCQAFNVQYGVFIKAWLGRRYHHLVPLLLVLVLAVAAEFKDMASYICSNWTKVTLICRHVNRASSQHSSPGKKKWVSLSLRCRCKLIMKQWDEKNEPVLSTGTFVENKPTSSCEASSSFARSQEKGQDASGCEVLHHQCTNKYHQLARCPAQIVPIIDGSLSNGVESLQRSQVGESFIWACHGKGTSDTLLVWHIATCILEVKHPYGHDQEQDSSPNLNSDNKIAATHLSRYCAYLVTWCPELLPDNNAWSKSLYKAVKKDAERALAAGHPMAGSSTPEDECQQLVQLLGANSKHEVLKNGVKLGKQLVETINDEETTWKLLADFWSEMILYIAPSENLKGHSEAIARGGELITLLWAMLFHAGIINRPDEEDGAASSTSAGTV